MSVFAGLLTSVAFTANAANLPDFNRYQVILDRKPFGEVKPASGTLAGAAGADSVLAQDLQLCAIIDDGKQIRVGLLDKRDSRTFYVGLGETVDQIELIDVDYDAEEAVLSKQGKTILLKLRPSQGEEETAATGSQAEPRAGLAQAAPRGDGEPRTSRRPFFAELRRRRAASTNQSDSPRGFAEFFKQANTNPNMTVVTSTPTFGPFQPVPTTNTGFTPFNMPADGVLPAGEGSGFVPFQPIIPESSDDVNSQGMFVWPEAFQPELDGGPVN